MKNSALCSLFFLFSLFSQAYAIDPDEILDDPLLEERARDLGKQLRCITCQSQSIDDSDAPLAKDLRLLVRERLLAGDSDQDVLTFMTDRYGDYVLLKPVIRSDTILLWLTPMLTLAGAGLVLAMLFGNRTSLQSDERSTHDDEDLSF